MKKFMYEIVAIAIMFGITGCEKAQPYPATVNIWKSDKDVANWLKNNWKFDKSTQPTLGKSAINEPIMSAEETYDNPKGWCKDAANFGVETLNKINPNYKAGYIFIENKVKGQPNHWVTGFRKNGKLYVIDYGAGHHWNSIMGFHGPYNDLKEYENFLKGVNAQGFEVDFVEWMILDKNSSFSKIVMQRAKVVLKKFDRNNDRKLSFKEAPKPMKQNFERLDTDDNKLLDEKELYLLPERK